MSIGHRIVLQAFASGDAMVRRSRADPEAVFIDVKGGMAIARGGHVVTLPPDQRKMLVFLLCAPGPCSTAELTDLLWAARADGGPNWAEVQIRGYMTAVKIAAAALGFAVDSGKRGYSAWRLREVRKPEAA